jgi:hypothetical protein
MTPNRKSQLSHKLVVLVQLQLELLDELKLIAKQRISKQKFIEARRKKLEAKIV